MVRHVCVVSGEEWDATGSLLLGAAWYRVVGGDNGPPPSIVVVLTSSLPWLPLRARQRNGVASEAARGGHGDMGNGGVCVSSTNDRPSHASDVSGWWGVAAA